MSSLRRSRWKSTSVNPAIRFANYDAGTAAAVRLRLRRRSGGECFAGHRGLLSWCFAWLSERERIRLGAGLEERDLHRPLADPVVLTHELVQAALP
jgi:hypothetical protein